MDKSKIQVGTLLYRVEYVFRYSIDVYSIDEHLDLPSGLSEVQASYKVVKTTRCGFWYIRNGFWYIRNERKWRSYKTRYMHYDIEVARQLAKKRITWLADKYKEKADYYNRLQLAINNEEMKNV